MIEHESGTLPEKVAYQPTEKRRFELSRDPYSRERIRGLLKAERTIRQEIPFAAGITLFGSLSKGKELTEQTAQATDIDVVAFIDADEYNGTIDTFTNDNKAFQHYFEYEYMEKPRVIHQDMDRVHSQNVERASEIFLAKRIKEIVHDETQLQPIDPEQVHVETQIISLDDDGISLFTAAVTHDEIKETLRGLGSENDITLAASQPLANPFFMDINNGLRPYRAGFIKKLTSLSPEEAEKHWQTTVNAMKTWERKHEIPARIEHTYPATVDEAISLLNEK